MKKTLVIITAMWGIALFIASFLAYFTVSAGPSPTDGLGRRLFESPTIMRIVFGQDRMWAGWKWFISDMVVFWGSIGAFLKLHTIVDRRLASK